MSDSSTSSSSANPPPAAPAAPPVPAVGGAARHAPAAARLAAQQNLRRAQRGMASNKPRERGTNYGTTETLFLLETLEKTLPIGPDEWDQVMQIHQTRYPNRDVSSLRRKFNALVKVRMPTGDPNCPQEVALAKRIMFGMQERADAAEEVELSELGFDEVGEEVDDNEGIPGATAVPNPNNVHVSIARPFVAQRITGRRNAVSPSPNNLDRMMQLAIMNMMERQEEKEMMKQQNQMMSMMMMGMMQKLMGHGQMMLTTPPDSSNDDDGDDF
jgi:hypothetical protein